MADASNVSDATFCKRLPKVELHAHLTGSITLPVLEQIWSSTKSTLPPPSEALVGSQSIDSFFAHFNTYIYRLISTPDILATATRAVLREFADDGVAYLELRTTPRALPGYEVSESLGAVIRIIEEWNAREEMIVRLILSVDQAKHDLPDAERIVDLALGLRPTVVGIDLCGDPNARRDIASLKPAFDRARANGLGVVLHFAEVPASSSREELEELLSWKPKRLGHVIHVPDDMRERILKEDMAVELCLSCNVLAGMVCCEMPDHHFGWWWSRGGSLSLGTDDVGVFHSTSSQEHELAARHFGLGRRELVELSRRAVAGALDREQVGKVQKLLDQFERQEVLARA